MNKTVKIYIVLLLLLFAGTIAIEFSKPKPVNWTRTFNERHKIPYGTFVLYNELPVLFPNSEIKALPISPYEYFNAHYNPENASYNISGSYLYIDDFAEIDEVSAQELLDFTASGNTLFIAANYIPQPFMDSLYIETKNDFDFTGKATLSLANTAFIKDSITIEKGLSNIYFSKLDTTKTTVLGYQKLKLEKRINFVKINHGSGSVYLHLQPVVFTNYSLLKSDFNRYSSNCLSYVPNSDIYYDSRNKTKTELSNSPLRFILSQPALKWAWILGLITLIVFILFNAKRRQRIIQIIKPLENTTISFIKTIANLYYETNDHNNLIDKKIIYFLEFIRRKFYLDTQLLDDKFVKNLALKSGVDYSKTKKTINLIVHLKAKQICNEADLKALNTTIEDFYTT